MKVIERIKQMRDDRNWSDYKLAEEAMIPASTLASIYARNTPPKLEILENICDAFGITLSQFFLEENEKTEIVNNQEKLLLEQFRKQPNQKKAAILALLDD